MNPTTRACGFAEVEHVASDARELENNFTITMYWIDKQTYLEGVDSVDGVRVPGVGTVPGEALEGALETVGVAAGEALEGEFDKKVGNVGAGLLEVVFGEAVASGQHIASACWMVGHSSAVLSSHAA